MFTILIQEKGGEQRRMVFNKPEVTIGRVQGNDIVLPKGNVSKRHARIVLKDGKFIIVDLKSTNGTYVNGRKITSPLVVKDSDKIYIGDFIVGVDEAASGVEGDGPSETTTSPPGDRVNATPEVRPPRPTEAQPMPPSSMPSGHASPAGMGMGMGGGMGGMGGMGGGMGPIGSGPPMPMDERPVPPAPIAAPRPGPPRPAPNPTREPPATRDPLAARDMPPIAPPPGGGPRPLGRPGGTMPPPVMQPIPPVAPSPGPTVAEAHGNPMPTPIMAPPIAAPSPVSPLRDASAPAPLPRRDEPPFASSVAAPAPIGMNGPSHLNSSAANSAMSNAPAPVVPMPVDKQKRALVGVGVSKRIGRSVSMPNRRGVHLEPLDPKVVKMLDLQSGILERLRAKLDLDKVPMERLQDDDLVSRAERATIDLVETLETSGELPKYIDQDSLIKETLNEALALGLLEDMLDDEQIDEIIIDRRDRVVVGKQGVLRASGKAFSSDEVFDKVVKRLVHSCGTTIDEAHPLVDLRMRDGTRLTAAVSPVASRGACIVLKKAPAQMPSLAELVAQNTLSGGMADFLTTCVTARRNILVVGGPASGKTTVVAALAAASPPGERVVSIEDAAELAVQRDEWIQLETRPNNGRNPEIDLATLLETALRLNPDRLVVGEVRGREALPLVNALCASCDGAVVAMTGEAASQALNRLVTLCRLGLPGADAALREHVAQAFEIVIHVTRWSDNTIRVVSIEEITGVTDTAFETQTLFQFSNNSFGATGSVPRFYAELEARGIPADQAVFR